MCIEPIIIRTLIQCYPYIGLTLGSGTVYIRVIVFFINVVNGKIIFHILMLNSYKEYYIICIHKVFFYDNYIDDTRECVSYIA